MFSFTWAANPNIGFWAFPLSYDFILVKFDKGLIILSAPNSSEGKKD